MGFVEFEDSVARSQAEAEEATVIDRFRDQVYQEMLDEIKKKVKQHTGSSRDSLVRREDAKAALQLLQGIEKLKLSDNGTITGEFVRDEELRTRTEEGKIEKKTFAKGTQVSIHKPLAGQKDYTGSVGSHTDTLTLHSVVNRYGTLLRAIDIKARYRASQQSH